LSDLPADNRLRVTVQACGDGSAWVADLQPGTRVAIEGPYETMTLERASTATFCFSPPAWGWRRCGR